MKCKYPNCQSQAWWVPVVALPTVRSSSTSDELVRTDKPTLLLFLEVCQHHKETYNLSYWMQPHEWEGIQKEARQRGYEIPDVTIIQVHFRPIDWEPSMRWMEVERS